jgi:hypothetical protein
MLESLALLGQEGGHDGHLRAPTAQIVKCLDIETTRYEKALDVREPEDDGSVLQWVGEERGNQLGEGADRPRAEHQVVGKDLAGRLVEAAGLACRRWPDRHDHLPVSQRAPQVLIKLPSLHVW